MAGCCTLDLCRPVPSCELVRKMAGPPDFRENICQAGTLKPGNCHHDRFPFFFTKETVLIGLKLIDWWEKFTDEIF